MGDDGSLGTAPAPADQSLATLVDEYESLLNKVLSSKPAGSDDSVYELLLLRDRIADKCSKESSPCYALAGRLCGLDDQLTRNSDCIVVRSRPSLENLRAMVQPQDGNWWWHLERAPNPIWTIAAVLFLTLSVTMITDFTRRMLSADPDELGILSIAVQALFAVAATSTFTEGGRQWIESLLAHCGVRPQFQHRWKLGATLALLIVVFLAWKGEPPRLAWRYNDRAFLTEKTDSASALELYQRAIALDPKMPTYHFNLGVFYEEKYEYEKASAEYLKTIVVAPGHVKAYANLSRVLLMGNQPLTALRVADYASRLAPPDARTAAALRKNIAWAEFQLGFYPQAEADGKLAAQSPDAAASAYCLLGKIYNHQGKTADARRAWASFSASLQDPNHLPMIEPDCRRLAEAASHEGK